MYLTPVLQQYPIAEGRHRREMKSNPAYAAFIAKVSKDPRLQKRDLFHFISRPVTRLPRVALQLESIFKLTDKEHPDIDTMPLVLTILSDFVKSTQPGVAVADAKVRFWALCENLVYRPGEIIVCVLLEVNWTCSLTGVRCRTWTCMTLSDIWSIRALSRDAIGLSLIGMDGGI